MIRKGSIDYDSERAKRIKKGRKVKFEKIRSLFVQEARHWLDFDRRLGVPNQVVFHLFIWLYTLIEIARLLIYEVEMFGIYNKGRGLTYMYVQMYPTPGVVALYFWYFCAGHERTYALILLYRLLSLIFWCTLAAYCIDLLLFWYDEHMFCTL